MLTQRGDARLLLFRMLGRPSCGRFALRPELLLGRPLVRTGRTDWKLASCFDLSDNDMGWCAGGVDVSMLRSAMQLIGGTRVETEASGNVTLASAREIASTGVSFISCGALTHSVAALDISLRIREELSSV